MGLNTSYAKGREAVSRPFRSPSPALDPVESLHYE